MLGTPFELLRNFPLWTGTLSELALTAPVLGDTGVHLLARLLAYNADSRPSAHDVANTVGERTFDGARLTWKRIQMRVFDTETRSRHDIGIFCIIFRAKADFNLKTASNCPVLPEKKTLWRRD